MSSIDRFKAAAEGAKTNRDYVSNNNSGSSSTSLKQLIANSYAELEATADEVDRSTGDSSSSSSGTSWLEITTAAITGITGLATAYATIKGSMGGNKGGNAGGGTSAGGGDPLSALQNATNTYSANPTKDNLKALATSISSATTIRDQIKAEVETKEENIKNLQGKIKDGQAQYADCKDIADGLVTSIKDNQNIIDSSNQTIATNQAIIDNLTSAATETSTQIADNKENQTVAAEQQAAGETAVGEADAQVQQTTTAQTKEQQKQDEYKAEYKSETGKTAGLETAVESASANLKQCSTVVNAKQNRVSGLDAQIKSNKKNKQDTTSLEAELRTAKEELKTAKEDLKNAEKVEKDAKKELENNKNKIADLEKKIVIGDQTLAQIKADLQTAKDNKAVAEQQVQDACTALRSYISEENILTGNLAEISTKKDATTEQQAQVNIALAKAITNDNTLVEANWNATEAASTISTDIANLNKELGDEKDGNTLRGKLVAYNSAISRAESVRDSGGADLSEITRGEAASVMERATALGYAGANVENIKDIIKNADGTYNVTLNDGTKQHVDAKGNKVPDAPAPKA